VKIIAGNGQAVSASYHFLTKDTADSSAKLMDQTAT
jgi:hypothetical protein